MTTQRLPWIHRAATLPPATPDEYHEASHAVSASKVRLPYSRIFTHETGYALDRPQWGRQPTAAELIGLATVAAAGGAGVWFIVAPPDYPTPAHLASKSDIEILNQCRAWCEELYPEVIWPADVWMDAASLFTDPQMQLAVDRVARMLQAVGHVPADVVCSVLVELGITTRPVTVTSRADSADVVDLTPVVSVDRTPDYGMLALSLWMEPAHQDAPDDAQRVFLPTT